MTGGETANSTDLKWRERDLKWLRGGSGKESSESEWARKMLHHPKMRPTYLSDQKCGGLGRKCKERERERKSSFTSNHRSESEKYFLCQRVLSPQTLFVLDPSLDSFSFHFLPHFFSSSLHLPFLRSSWSTFVSPFDWKEESLLPVFLASFLRGKSFQNEISSRRMFFLTWFVLRKGRRNGKKVSSKEERRKKREQMVSNSFLKLFFLLLEPHPVVFHSIFCPIFQSFYSFHSLSCVFFLAFFPFIQERKEQIVLSILFFWERWEWKEEGRKGTSPFPFPNLPFHLSHSHSHISFLFTLLCLTFCPTTLLWVTWKRCYLDTVQDVGVGRMGRRYPSLCLRSNSHSLTSFLFIFSSPWIFPSIQFLLSVNLVSTAYRTQ